MQRIRAVITAVLAIIQERMKRRNGQEADTGILCRFAGDHRRLFRVVLCWRLPNDLQQFSQVSLASDQLATETLFEGSNVRQLFPVSGDELTTLAVRVASGDYAHFSYTVAAD